MSKQRKYSEEFKREAIRLQESSGKSIGAIERELGLSQNLLRQWKERYRVNEAEDSLELSEIEQLRREVRQLKRELAITEQERDILKKLSVSSVRTSGDDLRNDRSKPRRISGCASVCRA